MQKRTTEHPGRMIRNFRTLLGWRQAECARFLGLSVSIISQYEKGWVDPKASILQRFSSIGFALDYPHTGIMYQPGVTPEIAKQRAESAIEEREGNDAENF